GRFSGSRQAFLDTRWCRSSWIGLRVGHLSPRVVCDSREVSSIRPLKCSRVRWSAVSSGLASWAIYQRSSTMKPNDLSESATLVAATLPPQTISEDVLLEKYAKAGEASIDDVRRRVANALALVEQPDTREQWAQAFYRAQV